jgi:hypothetical protein
MKVVKEYKDVRHQPKNLSRIQGLSYCYSLARNHHILKAFMFIRIAKVVEQS